MLDKARNANLRLLILTVLQAQKLNGAAEAGGWLRQPLLRRFLNHAQYPLDDHELTAFLDYLVDPDIACIERARATAEPPYVYKVRILAKGMRVLEGSATVPGIGVAWEDE